VPKQNIVTLRNPYQDQPTRQTHQIDKEGIAQGYLKPQIVFHTPSLVHPAQALQHLYCDIRPKNPIKNKSNVVNLY
jgi:hypothetical protein